MHTTGPAGYCSNRNNLIIKLLVSFIGNSSEAAKIWRKAVIVSFILVTGSSQLFANGSNLTATQVDWSKVPSASPPPRAGIFVKPSMGPGYFSLLDLINGSEREKPQIDPLPPSALTTTPAFDFDFRSLEQPGTKKIFLIRSNVSIWVVTGCCPSAVVSGIATCMRRIAAWMQLESIMTTIY